MGRIGPFLAQMALRGAFVQLAEPLVEMREHDNRYTRKQAGANGAASVAWRRASSSGEGSPCRPGKDVRRMHEGGSW